MPGPWAPALAPMHYLKTVQPPGGKGGTFCCPVRSAECNSAGEEISTLAAAAVQQWTRKGGGQLILGGLKAEFAPASVTRVAQE